MSKLEQLIEELCPNGVEYIALENLCKTNISPKKIPSNDVKDTGKYPVIDQGANFISGFTDNEQALLGLNKYIIFGDHTEIIKYVDFDFAQGADGIKILTAMNCDCRYLYHAFSCKYTKKGKYTRHWSNAKKTLIPLPPLPVQREIVRILDAFSEYTTELKKELREELTMRKKQYEYYRDSLLLNNNNQNRVLLKSMVKKSCSGGTPKKNNIEFYLNGTVPWLRTQDVKFNEIHEVNSFITEEAVNKTSAKWIPENCVIVAISGATAGRCAINKIPTTTNQHCYNMEIDETKALYKYVYYCVCSQYEELLSKKQGARGDLNSTLILGIEIPIPYPNDREKSLEEQKRIVDILDRFDTLCNDISKGLPGEIEARQKQYEYYRDKLLTFKNIND